MHKQDRISAVGGLSFSILAILAPLQIADCIPEHASKSGPPNPSGASKMQLPVEKAVVAERVLSEQEKATAYLALKAMKLSSPIDGFDIERIRGSFEEQRGEHVHHAADFVVQRNTAVLAVGDGRIARLFLSKPGGITIYQLDPSERFVYYYAHLERYADGLCDGKPVKKGELIGYVGTSGNAPPNTPHLHFSIAVLDKDKKYWNAAEVNPYEVLK